jgi:hypothetical protein
MPYHPFYCTNLVTQQKQKQHLNQLWWKHRHAISSIPGEEVLGQRARDEAYNLLQLSFVMLHLLQGMSEAADQQIQLQAAYQIQQTPILIGFLHSYNILKPYTCINFQY